MKIKKIVSVLLIVLFVTALVAVPVLARGENPPVSNAPGIDWAAVTDAFQSLLTAILVPVAAYLARWLFEKANVEKAKLTQEQQYALDLFLKTCVYAAEQMNLKGYIDDKLSYVINMAETWLAERNLRINLDEIHARIESIVMQELNKKRFENQ